MEIKIVGKNVEVTEAIKTRIEEKLNKLSKYEYLREDSVCHVVVRTVKNDQIIEVTIPVGKKHIIRAEKRSNCLYDAIDMVESTLARKIRKEKERTLDKKRESLPLNPTDLELIPIIVKEKTVQLSVMTPEEAADQMELLDHDFFVFSDADTGSVSIVYRRKDLNYGVLYTVK